MATDIATFKSALTYGGARPSLFEMSVSTATGIDAISDFNSFCNVSAIPPLTVTPIE